MSFGRDESRRILLDRLRIGAIEFREGKIDHGILRAAVDCDTQITFLRTDHVDDGNLIVVVVGNRHRRTREIGSVPHGGGGALLDLDRCYSAGSDGAESDDEPAGVKALRINDIAVHVGGASNNGPTGRVRLEADRLCRFGKIETHDRLSFRWNGSVFVRCTVRSPCGAIANSVCASRTGFASSRLIRRMASASGRSIVSPG